MLIRLFDLDKQHIGGQALFSEYCDVPAYHFGLSGNDDTTKSFKSGQLAQIIAAWDSFWQDVNIWFLSDASVTSVLCSTTQTWIQNLHGSHTSTQSGTFAATWTWITAVKYLLLFFPCFWWTQKLLSKIYLWYEYLSIASTYHRSPNGELEFWIRLFAFKLFMAYSSQFRHFETLPIGLVGVLFFYSANFDVSAWELVIVKSFQLFFPS